MAFKFRKSIKLGPVRWHFTEKGYSSYTVKIGPWSKNSRARSPRVDLPGPFSWRR